MDTVKKRGPKSKAEKAELVAKGLDAALSSLPAMPGAEGGQPGAVESDFQEPSQPQGGDQSAVDIAPVGIPPAVAAIDLAPEVLTAPANEPAPPVAEFSLPIPDFLLDAAIPLNEQCPADIRMALQAELGCVVTLRDGVVRAADGRIFRAVVGDGVIEVFCG